MVEDYLKYRKDIVFMVLEYNIFVVAKPTASSLSMDMQIIDWRLKRYLG